VKSGNKVFSESVVPPDIVAHRLRLNFDYGKLDYVIHHGEAILLDLNKTTGTAPQSTPQIEAIRTTWPGPVFLFRKLRQPKKRALGN